jgi:hypothetical protein
LRYSRLFDAGAFNAQPSLNQWEILLPVINIH